MKKVKIVLRTFIVVLALLALGLALWNRMRTSNQKKINFDYGSVSDFAFTDQTGARITRDSLKGHVWLANFIFTRCQGPCPLIAYKTSLLQKEIPAGTGLQFVSFSVDPEFDTPAVLSKYATTYGADGARWHFLTGDKKSVYDVIRNSFKLVVEPEKDLEEKSIEAAFVHSTHFVLVDKGGVIRGYYNSADNEAYEKMKSEISKWL